jgi:hypothetical protein
MNEAPKARSPMDVSHGSPQQNKLAPPIKRIIEQQKREVLSQTNPAMPETPEVKPKILFKNFLADDSRMNKSRVVCLSYNKQKNNN